MTDPMTGPDAATGQMADEARMCPCGCGLTWDQAVREMMRSPAAYNRDQAEYQLEQAEQRRVEQALAGSGGAGAEGATK